MSTRYAVRKISTRLDYFDRWAVVEIRHGRALRVHNSATGIHDEAIEQAAELNAREAKRSGSA